MKINVQWQYGSIRLSLKLQDRMQAVLKQIGNMINVDMKYLSLYYDANFQNRINDRGDVINARMMDKSIVYLKITTAKVSKPEICSMTYRSDQFKEYLGPNETEMTPEMKRVQKDFSQFTVSTAFIEHKNALKPRIDFQDQSSCFAFRIGKECMNRFQAIAFQENFQYHRIAFLFGRINETTGKVTAHVLVEPPQENFVDRVKFVDHGKSTINDDAIDIARLFGMKCVGMAISHSPDNKFPMTAYMVKLAAHYQNLYGEYFTTIVVMPRGDNDVVIEAFQVSDAAMKIDKEKLWEEENEDDDVSNTKNNRNYKNIVYFKEPLFTCNVKKNEADVNLLLCAVRVRLTQSKFISHTFPSPSMNPTNLDLKMYFAEKEFSPTWYQLFDFNLLLFMLQTCLMSKKDIETIVNQIIAKTDIPEKLMVRIPKAYENL